MLTDYLMHIQSALTTSVRCVYLSAEHHVRAIDTMEIG